jgi:hypothetical protein
MMKIEEAKNKLSEAIEEFIEAKAKKAVNADELNKYAALVRSFNDNFESLMQATGFSVEKCFEISIAEINDIKLINEI